MLLSFVGGVVVVVVVFVVVVVVVAVVVVVVVANVVGGVLQPVVGVDGVGGADLMRVEQLVKEC